MSELQALAEPISINAIALHMKHGRLREGAKDFVRRLYSDIRFNRHCGGRKLRMKSEMGAVGFIHDERNVAKVSEASDRG